MRDNPMSIEVQRSADSVVMIVNGELDLATVPDLQRSLDEIGIEGDVIVDCAGIEFMDSTGLNLLVTRAKSMRQAGGSLRLRHVSEPVYRILKLSGLISLIEQVGPAQATPRQAAASGY
ncbi:MAG TPA: STAS domain-containing protein [Ilumatobacteraceae bacterium]|jgi:anti-anti-sigma factor